MLGNGRKREGSGDLRRRRVDLSQNADGELVRRDCKARRRPRNGSHCRGETIGNGREVLLGFLNGERESRDWAVFWRFFLYEI